MTNVKKSLILNFLIFILVLTSTILTFTGIKFMNVEDLVLSDSKFEMFKYYTVDSNIFVGIVSLLFIVFYIFNKDKKIPKFLYILKLTGTSGVLLTFLTTTLYLAPFSKISFYLFYTNSNLFFHFIVPVLSVITFVFYEKNNSLTHKDCVISLIPTFIYALFYSYNVLIHMENGIVSQKYDWYGFAKGGTTGIIFIFFCMLFIIYLITVLLFYFNNRRENEKY